MKHLNILFTLLIVSLFYLAFPRVAFAANLYWVGNDAAATNGENMI